MWNIIYIHIKKNIKKPINPALEKKYNAAFDALWFIKNLSDWVPLPMKKLSLVLLIKLFQSLSLKELNDFGSIFLTT